MRRASRNFVEENKVLQKLSRINERRFNEENIKKNNPYFPEPKSA